jgi:hypothetical protein
MSGPWQVAQPLVIPVWLNWPPANVVMPAVAPLAGISIEGTLFTWHVSHAAVAGMWAGIRLAVALGLTPKKVPTPTLLPWQASHPVLMPLWLKAELANLAPFTTGKFRLELVPTWQFSQPSLAIGM